MPLIYLLKSCICIAVVVFLVYEYLKSNDSILQLLFAAFALKYFSIPLIGPTIDVLYLFSLFVASFEIIGFFAGRSKVSKNMLVLFSLPLLVFFLFLLAYGVQGNYYLKNLNPALWYLKTCANYVKTFLPYFLVGMAVRRQSTKIRVDDIFKSILKIATISCFIAILQLVVFVVFYNYGLVLELFGLNGGYNYEYSLGVLNLVRVQAFFYEPKSLAAFLGIATPIAFYYKSNWKAFLIITVGVFTLSQTFFIILLGCFFLFVLLKGIRSVRASILAAVSMIVMFFVTVSSVQSYLLDKYASQEETIAYKIFLDRALQRYGSDDSEENRQLLGIPLQPDIELPAVNFLRDNRIFIVTGFGVGNYSIIPLKYFVSQWNIDAIEQGIFKGHFDMGWIYLIAELGLFFFLLIFTVMTAVKSSGFESRFYSFLWIVFFFHRIDLLLIAFFCLQSYKHSSRENFNYNNILQSA